MSHVATYFPWRSTSLSRLAIEQRPRATHGGFYKHFESKDDLLVESLRDGFAEIADTLARAAEGEGQARRGRPL